MTLLSAPFFLQTISGRGGRKNLSFTSGQCISRRETVMRTDCTEISSCPASIKSSRFHTLQKRSPDGKQREVSKGLSAAIYGSFVLYKAC